jgi:hypothetical protein
VSKSVSIRPRRLAVQELETGPLHCFQDWPNGQVPKRAAGVYTVWDGDRLLYVGMSGRAMTAEDLEVSGGGRVVAKGAVDPAQRPRVWPALRRSVLRLRR